MEDTIYCLLSLLLHSREDRQPVDGVTQRVQGPLPSRKRTTSLGKDDLMGAFSHLVCSSQMTLDCYFDIKPASTCNGAKMKIFSQELSILKQINCLLRVAVMV